MELDVWFEIVMTDIGLLVLSEMLMHFNNDQMTILTSLDFMWNYFLLPKTWSEVCVRNWEAQDPLCPWLKTVFSLIGKHWGSTHWKKKYFLLEICFSWYSLSKVKSDKHWSEVPPPRAQSSRGNPRDEWLPHFPGWPRKAPGSFSSFPLLK